MRLASGIYVLIVSSDSSASRQMKCLQLCISLGCLPYMLFTSKVIFKLLLDQFALTNLPSRVGPGS